MYTITLRTVWKKLIKTDKCFRIVSSHCLILRHYFLSFIAIIYFSLRQMLSFCLASIWWIYSYRADVHNIFRTSLKLWFKMQVTRFFISAAFIPTEILKCVVLLKHFRTQKVFFIYNKQDFFCPFSEILPKNQNYLFEMKLWI